MTLIRPTDPDPWYEEFHSHPDGCLCRDCRTHEVTDEDERTGRSRAIRHRPNDVRFDGDG